MKKNEMRRAWFCLAAIALISSGCDKAKELLGEQAGQLEQMGKQVTAQMDGQAEMSSYIEAYNKIIDDPVDDAADCIRTFPESGPSPGKLRPGAWTGLKKLDQFDMKDAEKALSQAGDHDPKLAKHLSASLKALGAISKACDEMGSYYRAERFKEDKEAKVVGKLHAEAIQQFTSVQAELESAEKMIEAYTDKQALETLKEFKPGTFKHQYRVVMMAAKKLLTTAQHSKMPEFIAAEKKLRDELSKLKGVKHEQLSMIDGPATRMSETAEKLSRTASENAEKGKERLEKEMQSLVRDYNNLISVANSLGELEASGVVK